MIFNEYTARCFVARTWYHTEKLSKREKLYAKCRELVSGDRAAQLVRDGIEGRPLRIVGMEDLMEKQNANP